MKDAHHAIDQPTIPQLQDNAESTSMKLLFPNLFLNKTIQLNNRSFSGDLIGTQR